MKKIQSLAITVIIICIPILNMGANEIESSTDLSLHISSIPEAKLVFTQGFSFPFLRGTGPLTLDNNIKTNFSAELSPISLNGIAELIWTPIAFLEIAAGGRLGSGWNMPLGNGIGLNKPVGIFEPGNPRKSEIDGGAFDGLIWSAWGGKALQFDLAAVFPGAWNHVLFRVYDEIRYSAYSRAGSEDSWFFENIGEYRNGWIWHGNAVLGYQMPLSPVLDFVGLMAEVDINLYNTQGREYWGDNQPYWIFSSLFNFSINPRFSSTLILQMHTLRNYGTSDLENRDEYWYQDLELQHEHGAQRLMFYRAALIFNYKLR